jgi:hypothetical protein
MKLSPFDKLQIAFLKSFPRNICVSADKDGLYPYYLMLQNKELMKIHGSSLFDKFQRKPEWICCQNIVVSGVTDRQMTKLIIPIDPERLKLLNSSEAKNASKIIDKYQTRMLEFITIPNSILKFFRNKNRLEIFKEKLRQAKIYIESEEELEKVIYFYIADSGLDVKQGQAKIEAKHKEIIDYAMTEIRKKNSLIKISERTKIQVNENCQIVDVLSNAEFLGILIKNNSEQVRLAIKAAKEKLKYGDSDLTTEENKSADITFVYLNCKAKAKKYFLELKAIFSSKIPPINCKELLTKVSR